MKYIFYLLIFTVSIANSQDLQKKIATNICACFERKTSETQNELNLNLVRECFELSMEDYDTELRELLPSENDSLTYEQEYLMGKEFGKKMFSDMQEDMVNNCDSYYDLFSRSKALMVKNIIKDATTKDVDSLTTLLKKNPGNIDLLWQRGALNLGFGRLQESRRDLENCLGESPIFPPALFFLALSYDIESQYAKAYSYYEKLLNSNQNFGSFHEITTIYSAISKRNSERR